MTPPLLSISGLYKAFAVPVLSGIDIDVSTGEVHTLMGANGAGKTTLCNIICGLVSIDSGELKYKGELYRPLSLNDSENCNVRMVMQELKLIDNLSVAENIFLSELPKKYGLINFHELYAKAKEVLERFGLHDIDPQQKMSTLGVGQQQLVEIARILVQPCDLLILDEPTAALTEPQVELLFEEIAKLKANGTGIIYVSHRMDEIKRISDQITVLRDGKNVASAKASEIDKDEIIKLMSGSSSVQSTDFQQRKPGKRALQIAGLGTKDQLSDIELDIYHGEILGIAGLVGSGRTELLRAIYGADDISSGHIRVSDDPDKEINNNPQLAVNNGIGLITEDRKQQGLLLEQSIKSNMSLANLENFSNKLGWIDRKKENNYIKAQKDSLELNCNNIEQPIRELSGGNQQKVIIARWLLKNCGILLIDEPTRGIDVQTKTMIYSLLDKLARQGTAIVIVSSETEELFTLCDRIVVMSNGYLVDSFQRGEWTPEKITAAAFSRYSSKNAA